MADYCMSSKLLRDGGQAYLLMSFQLSTPWRNQQLEKTEWSNPLQEKKIKKYKEIKLST